MRLFIAIPVSKQAHSELAALVKRLERPEDGLRWMPPEMWHVTLQFLGKTTAAQYECLVERLGKIGCAAVDVHLGAVGFFERAGICHVGVERTTELLLLQKRVLEATAQCGFVAEARAYHPHVTLARDRGRGAGMGRLRARGVTAPRFDPFMAKEFLLYESFPNSGGSRYEVRARFSLEEA